MFVDKAQPLLSVYPFVALVGQEPITTALLWLAVDPLIGGVLITGTRGTAKSTAARALAGLLPSIAVVSGDANNRAVVDGRLADSEIPTPFIELPVGASEERVIGTIDMSALLKGERRFEPGLLARANRGLLYIDEVNLLPDHVVDVVLDAAATGRNVIERDSLSYIHEARIMLVGTMNPEEGELRPQLLDRFGLCVESHNEQDVDLRIAILERRLQFEADPQHFLAHYTEASQALRGRILRARELLAAVNVPREALAHAARLALEAGVEGMRADLTMMRTAKVIAALDERVSIRLADIERAAPFALLHRRRAAPPTPPPSPAHPQRSPQPPPEPPPPPPEPTTGGNAAPTPGSAEGGSAQPDDATPSDAAMTGLSPQEHPATFEIGVARGVGPEPRRRQRPSSSGARRIEQRSTAHFHVRATVRAALEAGADATGSLPLQINPEHMRYATPWRKEQRLIALLVDASGSMAATARMRAAKGVICSLLEDAYRSRDRVALIAFRGVDAQVLVQPTRSAISAYRSLRSLPTGGRTPLGQGLAVARRVLQQGCRRDPSLSPYLIVVSDARANVPQAAAFAYALDEAKLVKKLAIRTLCVDTEQGRTRFGLARRLAESANASYRHLDDCTERNLGATIREWMRIAA